MDEPTTWQRIPEGTLVYAWCYDADLDISQLEGPLEFRLSAEGAIEPVVEGRSVNSESIVVLVPGLVERELRVSLSGYGPAWSVELVDDELQYRNSGWGKNDDVALTLTASAWDDFARTCDELRIWRWRRRYQPRPDRWATDLPSWLVVAEVKGNRVVSEGYGVFPRTFWKFVEAMGDLVGGVKIE